MIDKLRIQNLRSVADSGDIELKPIMILLGANSSGKSTFLRSFPLFAQSVDKKLRGPVAWFDTSFVDYGDYKTAKNKYASEQEGITFSYQMSSVDVAMRRNYYPNVELLNSNQISDVYLTFSLKDDSKGTYIDSIEIKLNAISYELDVKGRNENIDCKLNGEPFVIPERFTFNFNTAFSILPSFPFPQYNSLNSSPIHPIHYPYLFHNSNIKMNIIFTFPFLKLDNFNSFSTFLSYNKYVIHTLYNSSLKHYSLSNTLFHSFSSNKTIIIIIITININIKIVVFFLLSEYSHRVYSRIHFYMYCYSFSIQSSSYQPNPHTAINSCFSSSLKASIERFCIAIFI